MGHDDSTQPAKPPHGLGWLAELASLSHLNSSVASFAPGTALGVTVFVWSGDIQQALLACVLGPPAIAAGRVLAKWIELLEP